MPIKSKSTIGQMMPPKLRLKLANERLKLLEKVNLKPSNKKHKFHLVHSKDVNEETYNKLMILFESLMKDFYTNSSWGWNESEKMSEWKHPKTRIMIVTKSDICDPSNSISEGSLPDEDENIIGFMCFRFEIGSDKKECALYVYELHIEPEHQRQGLGEELMKMAKIFATEYKMDKVMLTAFRSNEQALKFYQKLNYQIDKSSPDKSEADYIILSSRVKV